MMLFSYLPSKQKDAQKKLFVPWILHFLTFLTFYRYFITSVLICQQLLAFGEVNLAAFLTE